MVKILKKLSALFICLALAGGFSACKDDEPGVPFVKLSCDGKPINGIAYDCLGGECLIDVNSNAGWKLVSNDGSAAWVNVSYNDADGHTTLHLAVTPNKSASPRNAKFDFLVNGKSLAWLAISQEAAVPMIKVEADTETLPLEGGDVTFSVACTTLWDYRTNNPDVTEVSRTDDQLVLHFPETTESGEIIQTVTFEYLTGNEVITIKQIGVPVATPKADLLDINFLADGTAVDVSPFNHTVITSPASSLMTYFSDVHKRYVANFRHSMGTSITSGYYRINYAKDGDFIKRIADGCTLESIIKLNSPDNPVAEVKWFSSIQGGGIGFILPYHNAVNPGSKCISFLPNVSTTGTSNWCWTYSNVVPEVGKYYHVVGVWNKEEGKSYIYINGKLCGTADAHGDMVPVAAGAESFVLGGDAEPNQTSAASSFDGEIVTARIYDTPMTAQQVEQLWIDADFEPTATTFSVSNLQYLAECEVGPGYKYNIFGTGFLAGDAIEIQAVNSDRKYSPATNIIDGGINFVIPSDLTTGDYKLILKRDNAQVPLIVVKLTVSATPVAPKPAKIVAHRGAHTDGASENSIAALKKAMDANYFAIELDVWRTTDGRIVIHHDGVANGLTFYQCTYDQIKDIKLSNGEYLPTLDSFIATFKEKMNTSVSNLIIEIKPWGDATLCDMVMKMVDEAGIKDRVEYIAFSFDNCKYIASKQPDAKIGYLTGDLAPAEVLKAGVRSIDYSTTAYGTHPEWIKEARDLGMIVNVWTVNSADDMLKFIGLGADYITTDAPATLEKINRTKFVEP